MIEFSLFRLDSTDEQLWRGGPLCLRPKSFEVLRYLVEHPGCLVTPASCWRPSGRTWRSRRRS
jgi:DNA-binding response OmpR family regulator